MYIRLFFDIFLENENEALKKYIASFFTGDIVNHDVEEEKIVWKCIAP